MWKSACVGIYQLRLRPLHYKLLSAHHSRPLFQLFLHHNNFSLSAPREIKHDLSNTNELSCLVLKVMKINEMRNRGKCIKKMLKFALKSWWWNLIRLFVIRIQVSVFPNNGRRDVDWSSKLASVGRKIHDAVFSYSFSTPKRNLQFRLT